jgi:hypothetical protein
MSLQHEIMDDFNTESRRSVEEQIIYIVLFWAHHLLHTKNYVQAGTASTSRDRKSTIFVGKMQQHSSSQLLVLW